ncbi:hypothetical protein ACFWBN_17975 [Streptomyces sp. NPDC059989]|uniref:hypothetical protein n=1 Tax=Streptomyces sp. NPDC059989 TaxID=3347026 RepID=UPI00367D8704
MITEPELDGEWESERPADVAGSGDKKAGRPPLRPWLWALGGAVLASAVWAGVLTAQNRFADGPRISYRHTEELCKIAPMKALVGVTGPLDQRVARQERRPALEWATCDFNGEWPDEGLGYYGKVEVQLHRKTDPGPEFGAGLGLDAFIGPEIDEVQQVPGLGERALLHGYMSASRLQVLDGGTVFTLTVQWTGQGPVGSDGEADKDAVAAAMIEDARAVMTALKKG